jgi:hypothetical protein
MEAHSQCIFCLEDMDENSRTIKLEGCNHIMHTACFMDYLKHNLKKNEDILCPVCRHHVIIMPTHTPSQPHDMTPLPAPPTSPVITIYTRPTPQIFINNECMLKYGLSLFMCFFLGGMIYSLAVPYHR